MTNDPLVCFQATAISIDPKIQLDSVKALKTKDKGKETNGQDIEGAKKPHGRQQEVACVNGGITCAMQAISFAWW